ncbi:MAG: hypothetical protein ACM3WU_07140 [Bacillota bacterium]
MNLAGLVAKAVAADPDGMGAIAVVGTAKNVGKTVTMNYLAHELSAKGFTLGLVSSGRDGETVDSFTGEPKPSVVPPLGSWVATAEGVLGESASLLEIADVAERPGLLGRLVLGRVREPWPLELVGPGNARELAEVVRSLRALGAGIVLVDGALDRVAAANPAVSGAVVLATGAAADVSLQAIAERAGFLAWLWSRPAPREIAVRKLAREAVEGGRVAFIEYSGTTPRLRVTPYRTCLGFEEDILARAGDSPYVVVPGAVNQKFLNDASSWRDEDDFAVIASAAVNVFATEDPSVPILTVNPMRLLAVTVNPVSYRGASYESKEMVRTVASVIERRAGVSIPVYDVVSGESSGRGVAGMAVG